MFLSLAYQFGAIGLVAGDLSTIVLRLPLVVCVTVFTACAFTIYACAAGVIDDSSPANAPIIIIVWTVSRFVEAYVSTSTYRCIATHFPPEYRESAARAVGLNDQICTTCGAIISTFLVSSYGNC